MRATHDKDVSLDELERLVFAQRREQAARKLLEMLSLMADIGGGGFVRGDGTRSTVSAEEEGRLFTRVAGAMLALLADPQFQLTQRGYEALIAASAQAGAIFELSGYGSSEHIWRLIAMRKPDGGYGFDENGLRKAYALSSLHSLDPELVRALANVPRTIAVPALVCLLSARNVLSRSASEARNEILRQGHLLDDAPLSDAVAGAVVAPWMLCSYADLPEKHRFKQHLNRALREWMRRQGIELSAIPPRRPAASGKPRLAVILEFAHAGHAMMRCYSAMIASLRERFELVGVAQKGRMDAAIRALFDDVLEIQPELANVRTTIEAVRSLAADALYFPSVGMARWSICLANVRSAPLQFMTLGHPATSHCADMDAVLVPGSINFDPGTFSERVVVLSGLAAAFDLHPQATSSPPEIRVAPAAVKIAVPCKLFKLSADFLEACGAIRDRAGRPVEFRFFPNEKGALFELARRHIEAVIPGAIVYPTTSYPEYLGNLDECDLVLGAFTFGNTNGAIDALLRAIPMVALDGPEVHQGSEQQVMRPVGLPEWLIAQSREAYIEAAVRLIDDDAERVAISRSLVGRVEALLAAERDRAGDFAATVDWLYRNADEVRRDPRHCWTTDDRLDRA